ncbi:MAG: hypothetical protein CRN43_04420 [Candidatus Nephrothrix sp. EaCA]|nr:MAG: hypothetical protein CRN43_04420 [Candidatus Nephrothrix sp. EaCA]
MENSWYSLDWFSPSAFETFTWDRPVFLWLLLSVPFIFIARGLLRYFFGQKYAVAVLAKEWSSSLSAWLRFIPEIILAVSLMLLILSLARPQRSTEQAEQWSEGIDIVLALDISQSMMIEDFRPNRLEAAKEVARAFISQRPSDRIGLVIFSGEAFSLSPLTTDHDVLFSYLKELSFDQIDSRGTAIGSALAVVTNRMRESTAKSKVCILISDGDNTAGNIDPITAAELASAYSVKIYSILVGKEGLVPMGKNMFGQPNMVENTVDESTMRKIAAIGSGEFFRVADNHALKNTFAKIDQYEKEEIKETRFKNSTDYYYVYLRWALCFWLLWLLMKSAFLTNALED